MRRLITASIVALLTLASPRLGKSQEPIPEIDFINEIISAFPQYDFQPNQPFYFHGEPDEMQGHGDVYRGIPPIIIIQYEGSSPGAEPESTLVKEAHNPAYKIPQGAEPEPQILEEDYSGFHFNAPACYDSSDVQSIINILEQQLPPLYQHVEEEEGVTWGKIKKQYK